MAVLGVQFPFLSGVLRYVCDRISPCFVIARSIFGTRTALLYSTLMMNTTTSSCHPGFRQIRDQYVPNVHGLLSYYLLHYFLDEFVDPGHPGYWG